MPKYRKEIHPATIGHRFDLIISHFKLNLKNFANSLGYSQGILSEVRLGKKPATTRLIHSICATYGINEHWLTTGEGRMFDHDVIAVREGSAKYGENTVAEIMTVVSGMSHEQQREILKYVEEKRLLADLLAKKKAHAPV